MKKFKIYGEKTVRFEITVEAETKTKAIEKARRGDVAGQQITRCPDGFVLGSTPQVEEI